MGQALFLNRGKDFSTLPKEFRRLPKMLPPDLSDSGNKKGLWMVCEDWKAPAIDGKVVCVRGPVKLSGDRTFGFFSDGISVPALAWSIFRLMPFSMPELCGALGHDIVYSAELAPRSICDEWLREWERMATISGARRNTIYGVVRAFGGGVWKEHTKESVDSARKLCQIIPEGTEPVWEKLPDEVGCDLLL